MNSLSYVELDSEIGRIGIWASDIGVTALEIGVRKKAEVAASAKSQKLAKQAALELQKYFAGKLTSFSVPTVTSGTAFQRQVWKEISKIAFGKTLSYSEIAKRIGRPKAARAVGAAVGANPVPIIIGCHRVMGATGALTGYSGGKGIPTKKALLKLEGISFR